MSENGHEPEHRATGLRARSVPRPARAAQLETSRYGYPIMAAVDRLDGRAQFGTVSTSRLVTLATFDLCGLCGLPFEDELRWQVSTHVDAVENPVDYRNAFSEPPLHKACLMYSALVCPFLRSPTGRARDPEGRVDADLGSALLAYGLADTVGIHFDPSNSDHQLRFLQAGLAETDQWKDLQELEARYRQVLVSEEPISVEPNLWVIASALNRADTGEIADPGAQVFMAALVCGAALVPQVRELSPEGVRLRRGAPGRSWRAGAVGDAGNHLDKTARAAAAEHVIHTPRPAASHHGLSPHPRHTIHPLPPASSPSPSRPSSHPRVSCIPQQTPLHRGCAGRSSPVEVVAG